MSRCPSCGAQVEGAWRTCPLCRVPLDPPEEATRVGAGTGGPAGPVVEAFPAAPLRFHRGQLRTVLLTVSVLAVIASFAAQALIPQLMAPVRTVWLAVATLWLVVLAAVQRRRNVGSLVAWLVVLLSLAAVGWNRFYGPPLWATTWAIPAICTFANLALAIVVRVVRLDPAEHIAKAALVLLFGLMPGLFVVFGWVSVALPSLVCVGLSLALLGLMAVFRPRLLREALHRRLQV